MWSRCDLFLVVPCIGHRFGSHPCFGLILDIDWVCSGEERQYRRDSGTRLIHVHLIHSFEGVWMEGGGAWQGGGGIY